MNAHPVDRVARLMAHATARRRLVAALAMSPFADLASPAPLNEVVARKRHKQRRPKKAKSNAYGCVRVGKPCKNANQCCSGICEGK